VLRAARGDASNEILDRHDFDLRSCRRPGISSRRWPLRLPEEGLAEELDVHPQAFRLAPVRWRSAGWCSAAAPHGRFVFASAP